MPPTSSKLGRSWPSWRDPVLGAQTAGSRTEIFPTTHAIRWPICRANEATRHKRRPPKRTVLDMDSSDSPTYGEQHRV